MGQVHLGSEYQVQLRGLVDHCEEPHPVGRVGRLAGNHQPRGQHPSAAAGLPHLSQWNRSQPIHLRPQEGDQMRAGGQPHDPVIGRGPLHRRQLGQLGRFRRQVEQLPLPGLGRRGVSGLLGVGDDGSIILPFRGS